ncbi:MAG: zeta toxin family protein [Rickettsiales bacterium]|jgi:hypothetical protein|nr:zeta toxin family protein [Rickettsiales bacterium]
MDRAIEFMHSKWSIDCKGTNFDIGTEIFENIANGIYNNLTKNKKMSKNPFIFRIAGQSGSGKTTQLLSAIASIANDNFIHINIRMFSVFHPNYNILLNEFGEELIREKTNGFSLLMLFRIVEKIIKDRYNILFEMTLLDNDFERYLFILLKKQDYTIHFHILSIPKTISDGWIEKRRNKSKIEQNRVVFKTTSDYFYNVLPETLNKMKNYKEWNKNDKIIIWNCFLFEPVFYGNLEDKECLSIFDKYRKQSACKIRDENKLLEAKIIWLKDNYKFLSSENIKKPLIN